MQVGKIFRDCVAIVTGASVGIGREIALQLADFGASPVLASRNEVQLREVAALCREKGGKPLVVATDVGDKEQCRNLVEKTVAEFGRIDMLINNAGYGLTANIMELDEIDLLKQMMQVNFMGSAYCTYFALPHIVAAKGRLVGISSVAGYFAAPGSSGYNASKFAMRGFFEALRMELVDSGTSVTMIYPGYVVTEFASRVVTSDGNTRGEDGLRIYDDSMMTAAECASITLKAAARRKRQVLMPYQARIGRLIKMFFPAYIDKFTINFRKTREKRN